MTLPPTRRLFLTILRDQASIDVWCFTEERAVVIRQCSSAFLCGPRPVLLTRPRTAIGQPGPAVSHLRVPGWWSETRGGFSESQFAINRRFFDDCRSLRESTQCGWVCLCVVFFQLSMLPASAFCFRVSFVLAVGDHCRRADLY